MPENALKKELISLLNGANAHADLQSAVSDIPFELLGKKPDGLPYSIWQLTEHIRIAQNDILEFSRDPHYVSPEWPEGYWPEAAAPENEKAWKDCLKNIKADREAFEAMIQDENADLYTAFKHGNGQNLLREALLIADHNAYHTGQIILLRRLLDNWKK